MWVQHVILLVGLAMVTATPITRQIGLSEDVGVETHNNTEGPIEASESVTELSTEASVVEHNPEDSILDETKESEIIAASTAEVQPGITAVAEEQTTEGQANIKGPIEASESVTELSTEASVVEHNPEDSILDETKESEIIAASTAEVQPGITGVAEEQTTEGQANIEGPIEASETLQEVTVQPSQEVEQATVILGSAVAVEKNQVLQAEENIDTQTQTIEASVAEEQSAIITPSPQEEETPSVTVVEASEAEQQTELTPISHVTEQVLDHSDVEQQTELSPVAVQSQKNTDLLSEASEALVTTVEKQENDNVNEQPLTEASVQAEESTKLYPEASKAEEVTEIAQSPVISETLTEANQATEQVGVTEAEEFVPQGSESQTESPVEALQAVTQSPSEQNLEVIEIVEEQTEISIDAAEAVTVTASPVQEETIADTKQTMNVQQQIIPDQNENSQFHVQFSVLNDNAEIPLVEIGNQQTNIVEIPNIEASIAETTESSTDVSATQNEEIEGNEAVTEAQIEVQEEAEIQTSLPAEAAEAQTEGLVEVAEILTEASIAADSEHEVIDNIATQHETLVEALESQTDATVEAAESQTETYIEADESQTDVNIKDAESQTEANIEAAESHTVVTIEAAEAITEAPVEASEAITNDEVKTVETQTVADIEAVVAETESQTVAEIEAVEAQTVTELADAAETQTVSEIEASEAKTDAEIEAAESFTEFFTEAAEAQTDTPINNKQVEDSLVVEAAEVQVNSENSEAATESFIMFEEPTTTKKTVGSLTVSVNGNGFVKIEEPDAQEEQEASNEPIVTEAAVEEKGDEYWLMMQQEANQEKVIELNGDTVDEEFQRVAEKYGLKTPVRTSETSSNAADSKFPGNDKLEFNELRRKRSFADRVTRYVASFF